MSEASVVVESLCCLGARQGLNGTVFGCWTGLCAVATLSFYVEEPIGAARSYVTWNLEQQ